MVAENSEDGNVFPVLFGVLLQGVNVWSMIGNILIIIIVAKTPGLKGVTGVMLLNQAVGDILSEIFNMSVYLYTMFDGENFHTQIILRLGIFTANGVVAHALSALSINVYFAICRVHSFKGKINWTRVIVGVCMSWLINIAIGSLYILVPDLYVTKPTGDILMNLTLQNSWFVALLITNMVVFPFCSALFCFIRIYSFTRLPSVATVRKLKLAQMIQINTMVFLLTYIPLIIVMLLGVEATGARAVTATVVYSYHACKLFIYLKCYKPFQATCREMCCLNNRIIPEVRRGPQPAPDHMISVLPARESSL